MYILSISTNWSAFFKCVVTVECCGGKGLRASSLSSYTEVYAGQNA